MELVADQSTLIITCNSFTMVCPSVRGDNPWALASGLSHVQVDNHVITILYNLNQCGPRTKKYEIFRAKCELVKCGIKSYFSDFFHRNSCLN